MFKANPWLLIAWSWLWLVAPATAREVYLELPRTGLKADELAIIINLSDPQSEAVGEYYRERRGIPKNNLLRVRFPAGNANLPRDQFNQLRKEVADKTGSQIQAYALAWSKPYRVDCMSITAAFALGFDEAYCGKQCGPTKPSGYFNSPSLAPASDHQLKPTMMLAGQSFLEAKRLIDRGIASDYTYPTGTGYLLNTSDRHRSVRVVFYEDTLQLLGRAFRLQRLNTNSIRNKKDVLFYFTGLAKVPDLSTLGFIPGAIADHLTSAGGQLTDSGQMSSLRWLEAGATGSYGTVVEPCNHLTKFPHPGVAIWRYAEGSTLIEAYWKSVASPGEGVFIGEPLAKPFAPQLLEVAEQHAIVRFFTPEWQTLRLEAALSAIGPYRPIERYLVKPGLNEVTVHLPLSHSFYRIAR